MTQQRHQLVIAQSQPQYHQRVTWHISPSNCSLQQQVARHYNKNIRVRTFKQGIGCYIVSSRTQMLQEQASSVLHKKIKKKRGKEKGDGDRDAQRKRKKCYKCWKKKKKVLIMKKILDKFLCAKRRKIWEVQMNHEMVLVLKALKFFNCV